MTDAFNRWWNAEELVEGNPYNKDTPAYWAWAGWQAGQVGMANEEYEQALADEGQRRMLEFDADVRAMIKEAVEAEREACAKVCDDLPVPPYVSDNDADIWDLTCVDCAAAIRERGAP